MIKRIVMTLVIAVLGSFCFAVNTMGQQARPQRPRPPFMTEDNKIDLAKVQESNLPEARKKAFQKADKNGDGFLDQTEMKTLYGNRTERPDAPRNEGRSGSPSGRETRSGGTEKRDMSPFRAIMTEDGKIDLAKLDQTKMSPERKKELKKADKNNDGFVDRTEMEGMRGMMRMEPRGGAGREEFNPGIGILFRSVMTKDGKIDLAKLNQADTNKDGFLDQSEIKAISPEIRFPGRRQPGDQDRPKRPERSNQGPRKESRSNVD